MSPRATVVNVVNRMAADAELRGQRDASNSSGAQAADLHNRVWIKQRGWVFYSGHAGMIASAFTFLVSHILKLSPSEQVRRIYAWRVIAAVKHVMAIRHRADVILVRNAMRADFAKSRRPSGDFAVTLPVGMRFPNPAFIWRSLREFFFKPLKQSGHLIKPLATESNPIAKLGGYQYWL